MEQARVAQQESRPLIPATSRSRVGSERPAIRRKSSQNCPIFIHMGGSSRSMRYSDIWAWVGEKATADPSTHHPQTLPQRATSLFGDP